MLESLVMLDGWCSSDCSDGGVVIVVVVKVMAIVIVMILKLVAVIAHYNIRRLYIVTTTLH